MQRCTTRPLPQQVPYFPDWHVSARLSLLLGNGNDIIIFWQKSGVGNREKIASSYEA